MRLVGDPEVWGRCPKTLVRVENTSNESLDFIKAKTALLRDFRFYKEDRTLETFKCEQSLAELRVLRAKDPSSVLILESLIMAFDEQDITSAFEVLELKLELYELDPYCEHAWYYRPSSIAGSANALIKLWRNKDRSVADLGEETLLQELQRAHAAIMATYEAAYERSHDEAKLRFALWRINPKLSTDLLDDNSAERKAERRAEVVEKLEMELGINSGSERVQSLRMLCNDLAFEIGLLRNCVGLIERYAKSDVVAAKKRAEDIQDAGVRVLVATTRACYDLFLHIAAFDGLIGELCLVDESNEIASSLSGLFEPYEEFQNSAMFHLVQSYVLMNGASVAHFSRAVRMDDSLASHTFLLAKQLSQRGYNLAAIRLVSNVMSLHIGPDAIESI